MRASTCRAAFLAALALIGAAPLARGEMRVRVLERPGAFEGAHPLGPAAGAGRCAVLVERTPVSRRWQLSLLCLDGTEPSIRLLGEVTASRAPALGTDVDRDGEPLLLLGMPDGRLVAHSVSVDQARLGAPVVLLDDPSVGRAWPGDRPDLDGDGTNDLLLVTADGMAAWRRTQQGFERLASISLPRRAVFSPFGPELRVSASSFPVLGQTGSNVRWSPPEGRPGNRLALRRVSFERPATLSTCEAFIHTEEPLNTGMFRVLDGERGPLLLALALPARRVSVLGKWSLLFASLACDRTGRGVPPLAMADTPIPVWSSAVLEEPLDLNGDGIEDVVLRGVSGRLRPRAELLLYDGASLRRGQLPRPRGFSIAMKRGDIGPFMRWNVDLDDDGLPDLLFTPRPGRLAWIPGRRGEGRAFPLAPRPSDEISLPGELAGARGTQPVRLEQAPDLVLLPAALSEQDGDPRHVLGIVYVVRGGAR